MKKVNFSGRFNDSPKVIYLLQVDLRLNPQCPDLLSDGSSPCEKGYDHIKQSTWNITRADWCEIFFSYLAAMLASLRLLIQAKQPFMNKTFIIKRTARGGRSTLRVGKYTELNFNAADLNRGRHSIWPPPTTRWLSGQALLLFLYTWEIMERTEKFILAGL